MAGSSRGHVCRQGAGCAWRKLRRQLGAARNALRGRPLADGAYRRAGRPSGPENPVLRHGMMRSLEVAARKAGVELLLEHRMTSIHRQSPNTGPVLGIVVDHRGKRSNIRACKAVIIGTGGSTGNVNFRRMFDPRLTEEYCGLAGMPWSDQDASGELAAMATGAA